MTEIRPPRWFVADASGEAVAMCQEELLRHMRVPPAVSAATDLLTDDGMPAQSAADMAFAAERTGRDPEAFARHLLKLRRVMRDLS